MRTLSAQAFRRLTGFLLTISAFPALTSCSKPVSAEPHAEHYPIETTGVTFSSTSQDEAQEIEFRLQLKFIEEELSWRLAVIEHNPSDEDILENLFQFLTQTISEQNPDIHYPYSTGSAYHTKTTITLRDKDGFEIQQIGPASKTMHPPIRNTYSGLDGFEFNGFSDITKSKARRISVAVVRFEGIDNPVQLHIKP